MFFIMEKLGVLEGKYIDEVKEFGNMVLVFVFMILVYGLEK